MNIKNLGITAILLILLSCRYAGCCGDFTEAERRLIHGADSIMRVLTIENSADNMVLRAKSSDLSDEALLSSDYERLAELMVATVTHPSQDGVGIAGPQVGLNRRVVAVQRFDKEPVLRNGRPDYPFEVYPNVRIVWASDSLAYGPEGCLSVPDMSADILRSQSVVIEYTDMGHLKETSSGMSRRGLRKLLERTVGRGEWQSSLPTVRDTVSGFTAVIFQHEIDHLEGILYIDRLQ